MDPLAPDTDEKALAELRFTAAVKIIRDLNLCHRDGRRVPLDEICSWAGISAERGEELLRDLEHDKSAEPHEKLPEAKPSLEISHTAVAKKQSEEKKTIRYPRK